MTTEAALLARVRLEIGDQSGPFNLTAIGDGDTRAYELPHAPVSSFSAYTLDPATLTSRVLALDTDYQLDTVEGIVILNAVLPEGHELVASGVATKYFSDADLTTFIRTAVLQHLHNREGVSLANLPPVEEYPVALLAAIEALYALLNDAAFDIDVSTPEGVGIPRSQRFRQLQEMIELRKEQYAQITQALNVGLNRIEVFNLRRVSRTTGRLVPVYIPQELEDRQPPTRVFPPKDTLGAPAIPDPTPVLDIVVYEYGYFNLRLTELGNLTGWKIDARIRRYEDSSSLREFTILVNDLVTGDIELNLDPRQTAHLRPRQYWDLRLTNRDTREVRTLRKGQVTVIQQVGVDESVGPVAGF